MSPWSTHVNEAGQQVSTDFYINARSLNAASDQMHQLFRHLLSLGTTLFYRNKCFCHGKKILHILLTPPHSVLSAYEGRWG